MNNGFQMENLNNLGTQTDKWCPFGGLKGYQLSVWVPKRYQLTIWNLKDISCPYDNQLSQTKSIFRLIYQHNIIRQTYLTYPTHLDCCCGCSYNLTTRKQCIVFLNDIKCKVFFILRLKLLSSTHHFWVKWMNGYFPF